MTFYASDIEKDIVVALDELDELATSLMWIDKQTKDENFSGWRGGKYKDFNAYEVLRIIQKDLKDLLEERA